MAKGASVKSRPEESSARDAAYQTIRGRIVSLELKPGQPLSDKVLAGQMGVSRTPVREAILLLAASGLVLLRPQRGTFVAPVDAGRVAVELFSRYALEKEVLSRAAPLMTSERLRQYEENLLACRRCCVQAGLPDGKRRLLELDAAFHRLAFTAAGREDSFLALLDSTPHSERLRFLSLEEPDPEAICRDHQEIFQALRDGGGAAAALRLERHLARYPAALKTAREKYPAYFSL